MDSVHGAVDRASPVHRGPVAIAVSPSSSELSLRLLRWSGLPDEGLLERRQSSSTSSVKAAVGRAPMQGSSRL
jgi:hypothetical protein